MIEVCCKCGEVYYAEESHTGRSLRCWKCGRILPVERKALTYPSDPPNVERVTTPSVDEPPARHVIISSSARSHRKKAVVIGGAAAAFVVVLILVEQSPGPSTEVSSGPSPSTEQAATPPPTPPAQEIEPSRLKPLPPIPRSSRSSGKSPPAPARPDDVAVLPATRRAVRSIRIPPCAQGQQVERLPTGARIEPDEGASGFCELRTSNGSRRDAAVRLVYRETGRTARLVYIRAGDEYTLAGIELGIYLLRYVSGKDWMPACRDFLREADYAEFERALLFEAVMPDYDRKGYATIYVVTLNPVPLGNARTRAIDRKRFFEGDQHVTLTP